MAAKIKKPCISLVRTVFINKKTGQRSITLPKKELKNVPKVVRVNITW